MSLSHKQRKALLAGTADRSEPVIKRTIEYLSASGLRTLDLAARINYSRSAVDLFINRRYHKISANDSLIVAALTDYMDRNPVEPPTEVMGKLYETENVGLIRRCFTRALNQRCAYYFRGAPGCQKTFVLEHLIAELNREEQRKAKPERRAYYVRCRPGIKPGDLMKRVALAVGVNPTGNIDRIIHNLRYHLRGLKSLLVFDEAQFLSISCLETVRELLDLHLVGLLFAGSHQLEDTFDRLDMAQWRSRIRKGEGLPGLSLDEARTIFRAELPRGKQEAMEQMISACYETDYYRGEKRKYISARLLFLSIEEVQLRKQESQAAVPKLVKGASA
jgi:DNA transposition AAA+ family ATPase